LQLVIQGIDKGITNDILAMEIRQALHHLVEITDEISTDDLLDNIFSKFCPACSARGRRAAGRKK
jgi:tRNA modification GTPase